MMKKSLVLNTGHISWRYLGKGAIIIGIRTYVLNSTELSPSWETNSLETHTSLNLIFNFSRGCKNNLCYNSFNWADNLVDLMNKKSWFSCIIQTYIEQPDDDQCVQTCSWKTVIPNVQAKWTKRNTDRLTEIVNLVTKQHV
jgi:hypothetical protein